MINELSIAFVDDETVPIELGTPVEQDPGVVVLTCTNCGAAMDERKCKLICRCGYFLSCSDYS
jgi:exosome complex RNA-binding protein Csl4